jgi:hypothetical protein
MSPTFNRSVGINPFVTSVKSFVASVVKGVPLTTEVTEVFTKDAKG